MAHQWDPEQTLEASFALELIKKQFPEIPAQKIRPLGAGWDNTAFLVDEDLVFRFPRREIAVALLEAEWSILPKLAPHLSLPIPIPKWKGSPSPNFSWPFIGYKMISGLTACNANLSEEERDDLAQPIAHFLSKLHSIPKSTISDYQISGDNYARIDWKQLRPKVMKNLEELSLLNLLENKEALQSLVENLQNLRPPSMSCIVHGDFYVRHILVDEAHHLSGVIDWGDVHIGDPAIDLAIAHSFLPKKAHAKFREAYGKISTDTWSLALLRALFSSTMLVLYGHHSKDTILLREGLRSLKIIANK